MANINTKITSKLKLAAQSILIVASIISTNVSSAKKPDSFTLDGSLIETVGNKYNIDPLLLYSIAIAESATGVGNGNIGPTPLVLRSKDGPVFFKDKKTAEIELTKILQTTNLVDVGLMQINLHYHPQENPLDLLDPYHNLSEAARYLKTTLASTTDPVLGVGRYHSWDNNKANWYGHRIWTIYRNLISLLSET